MSEMFEGYPELAAQMERASGRIADAAFRLMERRLSAYSDFFAEAGRSFAPAEGAGLPARYFERMMGDYGAAFGEMLAAWPVAAEGGPVAAPVAERLAEAVVEAEAAIEPEAPTEPEAPVAAAPDVAEALAAEDAEPEEAAPVPEAEAEAPIAAEEPASFDAAPAAKPSRARGRPSDASAADEPAPPTH